MTLEYDDKGKFFTDVISKVAVPAIVQTTTHQIHGMVHIRPGERLKDELDRDELFMALTDARLIDSNGNTVYQTDFVAVRRAQIVWAMPDPSAKKD
ncbi:MAG: hypothetical protein ACOYZ8_01845 [Chloroflexota bacterium]